jgi:hypothetical protein
MMRRVVRSVPVTLLLGALLAACAAAPSVSPPNPVAAMQQVDGLTNIVLVAQAAERIGIKTTPVLQIMVDGRPSAVIPYSALIYDTSGDTFAYTNPAPLTFVRHVVRVQAIQGDQVVLAEGPPAGAAVVSIGASQLLGIELGVGL